MKTNFKHDYGLIKPSFVTYCTKSIIIFVILKLSNKEVDYSTNCPFYVIVQKKKHNKTF